MWQLFWNSLLVVLLAGGTTAQSIADLLQRHNDNLLQQTMLRSLQNQVNFFGGGDQGQGPRSSATSLMNQLSDNVNRMTQSMMEQMRPRVQNRPSIFDNSLNNNVDQMPVNVVLRQPNNAQNALNVPEPTPQQPHTILMVPVGQNRQWGSTLMETVLPQMTRNGVNIVMVERNETSGMNKPTVTKTTTTRISEPNSPNNSSLESIFSKIRAPNTVTSFLTGTPDINGKVNFNTGPQNIANNGNIVRIPGSSSIIVLDGNNPIDPRTLGLGDNAMSVVPGMNIQSQGTGSNPPGPDPTLPFSGGFPTRQRSSTTPTRPKTSNPTQPSKPETKITRTVTPAKPNSSSTATRGGSQKRRSKSQGSRKRGSSSQSGQKRGSGVGVPVNPNIMTSMTTPPAQTSGSRSPRPTSPRSSLIYSQDTLTCSAEFQSMPGHTLCMQDNADAISFGVSANDKMFITQFHNDLRSGVQPPATDLMNLQWDERLASVAQKWALQCVLAHDDERKIPELGMSVGQNVAVGFDTWQEAIQMWYDEISMYRYGEDPDSYLGPDGWRQIAHFTQIVQNGTYLVGCGYSVCPNTRYKRFYVCNYAAGQSDLAYPYTAGSRCEQCPNSCNNGLCDCGGIVCQNKGRLDPTTCKCECPRPYTGNQCQQVDCPAQDNWICGRDWPRSHCDRYYNVPEECPHMCGICGKGGGSSSGGSGSDSSSTSVGPVNNITTFTSEFGCQYTGVRDDEATCRAYGDNGNDMKMCATQGGNVGCNECERYFNIKKDYCPVMCGLCDPPCKGKRCANGGTLDTTTCTCKCRKPFTGDTCEFAQCPVDGDPGFCRFWPKRYCQMYYNVPEECPFMCGICKAKPGTKTGSKQKSGTNTAEANEI